MKANDTVAGALLLALAAGILFHVHSFPNIRGQNIGPAAFPGLLAVLLALCAIALIVRGLRSKESIPWLAASPWVRSPAQVANFALTVGVLLFMAWGIERVGFIPCGVVLLFVLLSSLRVNWRLSVPLALGVTLLIHTLFYKLLRVPLPWGWLEGVAW